MTKQMMKATHTETGEADEVMRKLRKSVVESIITGESPLKAAKWFQPEEIARAMARDEQC